MVLLRRNSHSASAIEDRAESCNPRWRAVESDAGRSTEGLAHHTRKQQRPAWTSDGFRASWRKACANAGVRGVTFHDLRGTAVTRLALVGATEPEIATVTGLSLKSVREILDAHYLDRDPALGESAITKLERGTKMPN